jgi:hypothetical protein
VSYAPDTLRAAREFYIDAVTTAGYRIDPLSVGIVGDDSHAATGSSYHLGKDALRADSYSIIESTRDRKGLTDAAAAVDYGWFDITADGTRHTLRTFSAWLVDQCREGAADTADIREVIYSLDGRTVHRWTASASAPPATVVTPPTPTCRTSRDSENRDKTALLRRYFTEIGAFDVPLTPADVDTILARDAIPNPRQRVDAATNKATTWGFAVGVHVGAGVQPARPGRRAG